MARLSFRPTRRFSALCAFSALFAAAPVVAAQGVTHDHGTGLTELPSAFPSAVNGQEAMDLLGNDLEQVAEDSHLTLAEFLHALEHDGSLWITGDKRVIFVDPAAPEESESADGGSSPYEGTIPLSDAFLLHSRPGSDKKVYMDFNGHHSVSNAWGHNIQFPPYNTSGSSATFTDGERGQVIQQWLYCVEDFAAFDIDVTTEEPPVSDLVKNGSGDTVFGIRVVCTQATSGFGNGIGGVAFLNSFNDSTDNPCFAFNKGNNTGSMTISHEAGHTFGLSHDGLNGSSYHPGSGGWGPIMGAPFGSSIVHWSNGDYSGATTGQNDNNIITNNSNGVDFLVDDHDDDFGGGTPVPSPVGCPVPIPGTVWGVIELRNETDAFTFSTGGGVVTVTADPVSPYGNLDIGMEIFNSSGVSMTSLDPQNTTGATAALDLAPGTYTVVIDGVGKSGVYSDYGSRGQYSVAVGSDNSAISLGGGIMSGAGIIPLFSVSGTPCSGEFFSMNLFGAPANAPAWLAVGLAELSVPFKGGILVPDISPPGGLVSFQTSIFGIIQLSTTWPAGIPPASSFYFQFWIQDAGAVAGFVASDGLLVSTP